MTSISNGESGSSVRTKLNSSLAVTDAFSVASGNLVVAVNSASAALTVTQTGAGNAFVVEDSTNPDSSPFVVDASGYVGIGTTVPSVELDVWGSGLIARLNSTTTAAWLRFDGSGTSFPYIGLLGGIGVFGNTDASPLAFNTNSQERMRITADGNVGIGTITPNAASIVDAQSTTKGVRFPNMTTTQKNAIANVAGNVVFDTTLGKLCVNTGSGWQTITSV